MLYGTAAGDLAGSTREFVGFRGTDTELIPSDSQITDDTILTLAVAYALMHNTDIRSALRSFTLRYPHPMGGYGSMYSRWIMLGEDAKPYRSYGNGSAMRVAACGWVGKTLEEVLSLARQSALPTHNHPEGIKGAQATAACIFLARTGKTKDEIRQYINDNFYPMDRTFTDLLKSRYKFGATCQDTVPEAIISFLASDDFESAVRNAMLTNKDTDTAGAIAGSIAEAYYGVPDHIKKIVRQKLDKHLLQVLDDFKMHTSMQKQ